MKSKFVSNEGVRLHYVVSEGHGPAVLLLHGGGSNHTVWKRTLPYLNGRKLILPDYRGHGKSHRGHISLEHMISDLLAILEEEKEEVVDIVGYSVGAVVAAEFARRYQDKINKLVLMSIVSRNLTRFSKTARIVNLALLKLLKRLDSKRKLAFQDYSLIMGPIPTLIADLKGASLTAYLGLVELLLSRDLDLSGLRHKTLILQGKLDPSFRRKAFKLNKNAELKYLSTHHLLVNKPEELGPLLRSFLHTH